VQALVFILLLGLVQATLLGIFFLHKRVHRQGYFFLLLYISVIFLQLAAKLISKAWLIDHMNVVYTITYHLPFLYGPLIYFFIREAYNKRKFRLQDSLHFIPFTLILFHFAFADPNEYPLSFLVPFFKSFPRLIMQLISLAIYHFLALTEWKKYKEGIGQHYAQAYQHHLRWVPRFIFSSLAVTMVIAVTIYFMYIFFPLLQPVRFGFAVLTLFVYWISYSALSQPQLFSVIKGNSAEWFATEHTSKLFIHRPSKKYANSTLGTEETNRISACLDKMVTANKVFLDPDVTIEEIAEKIGCSKHHLSQVLNEHIKLSFYDYINHFRVEEAKQLLTDPGKQSQKIASIAFDSGFNSISTFNEVFKKNVGCTPSEWRKQPKEDSRKERV